MIVISRMVEVNEKSFGSEMFIKMKKVCHFICLNNPIMITIRYWCSSHSSSIRRDESCSHSRI